ncbi:MAB_1171c family putative transporter [Streptomyces platensis]|uniref:MAB_1171c family putative transporter n=1 Tax=Streptomyces platensis TaxID=58346 RepID=UPI00386F82CA|nr:hypothetical protein OG962_27150 [Streptomyces platensis]
MIPGVVAAFNLAHPACAAASFLALGYKLRDLRQDPGNAALKALCTARLCTALAWVWLTPWLYVRIDHLTGIANLSALLSNGCIVLSALSTQLMLLGWFHDPAEARRKAPWVWAFFCAALMTMIVLFLSCPLHGEHPVDFEVRFARVRHADAYIAVYLATYIINLANIARLTWPPSHALSRPWLRRSLQLTALGSIVVAGYPLGKLLGVAGRWFGTSRLDAAAVLGAPICAIGGSLVLVIGGTFPGWGQRLLARVRQYQSVRRLYPLWFALYQATPGIALFPRRSSRPPWFVPDLQMRLYRLIIEIRDGQRALRPYVDAAELAAVAREARAAGLDKEDLQVTLEAVAIRLGVREKAHGALSAHPGTEGSSSPSTTDLVTELAWLERVAHAFARSSPDERPGPRGAVAVRRRE